ncbi:hypothetical protein GCM10022600_23550 [Qipengyuania pelagi]
MGSGFRLLIRLGGGLRLKRGDGDKRAGKGEQADYGTRRRHDTNFPSLKDASPIVAPHDRGVSVAFRIGETGPFRQVETVWVP